MKPWETFQQEKEGPWSKFQEEDEEPKRRTPMEMAAHYAGLVGRGAVKGVVGSAEQFIPPIYPPGGVGRKLTESIDPAVEKGLTGAGLPEPENLTQKIVTGASELLPGLIGGKGVRGAPRTMPLEGEALRKSASNAIIDAAKAEGYVVPGQTTIGKIGQLVAGKTSTRAGMTIRNQEVTNKIARREAGLAEDMPITDEALKAVRKIIAKPYEELSKMSPAADRLWKQVQQVRAEAKLQSTYVNTHGTQGFKKPDEIAKLNALNDKAERLEEQIDKIAQLNLKPDMLQRLRDARTKFAKNYAVDRANTPGGNVDAKVIARDKGVKTDGLKLISDFEIERRPHFGVEMDLEPELHMGGGLGLHHIGLGGWSRGIPFMGPAGRGLAMSKLGQGPKTPTVTTLRDLNPALLFGPGLGLKARHDYDQE